MEAGTNCAHARSCLLEFVPQLCAASSRLPEYITHANYLATLFLAGHSCGSSAYQHSQETESQGAETGKTMLTVTVGYEALCGCRQGPLSHRMLWLPGARWHAAASAPCADPGSPALGLAVPRDAPPPPPHAHTASCVQTRQCLQRAARASNTATCCPWVPSSIPRLTCEELLSI